MRLSLIKAVAIFPESFERTGLGSGKSGFDHEFIVREFIMPAFWQHRAHAAAMLIDGKGSKESHISYR